MCNVGQVCFSLLHILHKKKKWKFMMHLLTKILQAGGTQRYIGLITMRFNKT